jgi:hypothetical protein
MSLVLLVTVALWLLITQRLTAQVQHKAAMVTAPAEDIDCERFPDQCPCTTELGKGVA